MDVQIALYSWAINLRPFLADNQGNIPHLPPEGFSRRELSLLHPTFVDSSLFSLFLFKKSEKPRLGSFACNVRTNEGRIARIAEMLSRLLFSAWNRL
jgi:hypothetical protein